MTAYGSSTESKNLIAGFEIGIIHSVSGILI